MDRPLTQSEKIDQKVLGKKPDLEKSDTEILRAILNNARKTNSQLGTIKGILIFFLVISILAAVISFFGAVATMY